MMVAGSGPAADSTLTGAVGVAGAGAGEGKNSSARSCARSSARAIVREAERVAGTGNKKKRKGVRKKKTAGTKISFHRCSLSSTGRSRF